MDYTYTLQNFVMPSDALRAFENKVELYISDCNTMYKVDNMHTVVENHTNLFTRQEKTIDYAKEFLTNTPWMVSNSGKYWYFSYACSYLPKDDGCFHTFSNKNKSERAHTIVSWTLARHLTKEEEIEFLTNK